VEQPTGFRLRGVRAARIQLDRVWLLELPNFTAWTRLHKQSSSGSVTDGKKSIRASTICTFVIRE
jgi:hypothetical protein